ncbi:MAG TPA: hypothetical protein VNJ11_01820, partial [Bryobacteraceae bacterium]|nr:hypothetical protein [Bryobacteraceae bacterium]
PGRYELRAEEGYFHIVPTARADVTGVLRAVRSPLDATVTLEGGGRNPNSVVKDLLKSLELVSGYRVVGGFFPTYLSGDFRIEQRFENANARAVLRAILRAVGGRRTWFMMWGIWDRQYGLSIVRIPEEDELKGAAGKRGGRPADGETQV